MNIVIFTDTYLPKIDGVSISVDHFTSMLAERGHNFLICAPRYGAEDTVCLDGAVKVLRFSSFPLFSYPDVRIVLPDLRKLKRAMSLGKADLIHVQTPGLMGQYGALLARRCQLPLVGTYHTLVAEQDTYTSLYRLLKIDILLRPFFSRGSIDPYRAGRPRRRRSLKKRLIRRFCNAFYEKCQLIISPSHLIQASLVKEGVRRPIHVVSNGANLENFRGQVKKAAHDPPKFLHVGRISYEKNCDVVLRAFALIQGQAPTATLDVIGDGPALHSLKSIARRLKIDGSVVFHGMLEHDQLCRLYPRYDLFLTASTMETQGLVVLEAMASGLPCVGVDAFALPELIQHEQNGFIVPPFDQEALAGRAMQIVQDASLYRRFSAHSLAIAKRHDLHSCASILEEIYRSLL